MRCARLAALCLGLSACSLAACGLSACKESSDAPGAADASPPAEAFTVETIDAGVAATEGGAPAAPMIAALASPTIVSSAPSYPPHDPSKASDERMGVVRLGYLRKGATVPVKADVIKKANCPEGWFELLSGGFVCGKYATLDLTHKELALAPHAPFEDRPLPYDYGLNLTNGTPLYRRSPLRKERAQLEKGLAVGKTPHGKTTASIDEGGGSTPWYLRDHKGQRPSVTFDDLRGESTLLEQRMVRGFYVALDKEVRTFSGKFLRTTRGFLAPADHILVHRPKTEFEGVRIGAPDEPRKLPIGYVLGLRARRYTIGDDKEKVKRGGDFVPRFTTVQLTGKRTVVEGRAYFETDEGWWLRDIDGTMTAPGPAPKDLLPDEKWIDVNVTSQTLVAFEGQKPVFATLLSSGRPEHPTKLGSFRIREKHVAATMDADDSTDGIYSIQDVPWIMYFQASFALHGAFWHSGFGHVRSHGCVNLQPRDARTLFEWAGPHLPPGWHGIRATETNPGTRVVVHE